jgi:hypothetical protein
MDISKIARSLFNGRDDEGEVRDHEVGWRSWIVFDGSPFLESRREISSETATGAEDPQINVTMAYSLSERFSSLLFAPTKQEDLTNKSNTESDKIEDNDETPANHYILPNCFPQIQFCSSDVLTHDIEKALPNASQECAPCEVNDGDAQKHPCKLKIEKQQNVKRHTPKQHFRVFSHGRRLTIFAVGMAWFGTICSIDSRLSTAFVRLDKAIEVVPAYQPISHVGMIRLRLCERNETVNEHNCFLIRLSPHDVQDRIFEISRSFLSLGTALGFLLTLVLSSSVYWETINLKPVGFGFLITYFFQTLSMLVFDSKLCNVQSCRVGSGAIISILACFFWIGTCVVVTKMDWFKIRAARLRRKAARKKAKQARREAKRRRELAREKSSATISTDESDSS